MFQRVLKAAGNQSVQPPPSPSSKADMPAPTPTKARPAAAAKENAAPGDRDRASYLSFLWQDKQGNGQPPSDEDVHMHTMKGAPPSPSKVPVPVKGYHYVQPAQNKHLAVPGATAQDVHMRTAKETTKEKVLEPWERELLAKDEVKRRATVAQICKLLQSQSMLTRLRLPRLLL
jgi:hypothetical protein